MIELVLLGAAALFRPPLGVPISYVAREDRTIGGQTMHFESRRSITFARGDAGFVATIRFERAADDAGGDVASMFQAAMASFADRTVTLHLDVAGNVTGVDDAAVTWTALCDAVAALPGDASRHAHAASFAAALRAIPQRQRAAMLGSLIAPIIAGDDARLLPGSVRPVEIAARPPLPPGTTISGTQTVTRGRGDRLVIRVVAAGDASTASGAAAHVASDRERVIDAATGLVLDTRDHLVTTVGDDRSTTDASTSISFRYPDTRTLTRAFP